MAWYKMEREGVVREEVVAAIHQSIFTATLLELVFTTILGSKVKV